LIAGNAVCDGCFMIDLSPMRSVRIDPEARLAHVEPGDHVISIDGRLAIDYDVWELRPLLRREGAKLKLVLQREGNKIEVTLTLRRLI